MIRVSVVNNVDGRAFGAKLETQNEADAWVTKQTALGSWGLVGQYTVTQTDITEEVEVEARLEEVDADVTTGKRIKTKISSLMRKKLADEVITLEEMAEFVERDAVKKVERYLGEGYLQLAKAIILSNAFDPVTSEEKNQIISEIG